MPTLIWRGKANLGQLIAKTPLKNGSEVLMEGSGYSGFLPKHFYLYRTYTPATKKFLRSRGKDPYKFLGDEFIAHEYPAASGTARSEPFPLTASGFYFHAHRWLFKDSSDNWCPYEIRTARFGGFDIAGKLGGPVHGVQGDLTVSTTVSTCLDPTLEFSILVPWEGPDRATGFSIQNLAVEDVQLVTDDFGEEIGKSFRDFQLAHLERYGGWKIDVSSALVELGEGESAPVDVHVTIGQGRGSAFAVQAKDVKHPDQSFVSDIVLIQRSDSGEVTLYADDDFAPET